MRQQQTTDNFPAPGSRRLGHIAFHTSHINQPPMWLRQHQRAPRPTTQLPRCLAHVTRGHNSLHQVCSIIPGDLLAQMSLSSGSLSGGYLGGSPLATVPAVDGTAGAAEEHQEVYKLLIRLLIGTGACCCSQHLLPSVPAASVRCLQAEFKPR